MEKFDMFRSRSSGSSTCTETPDTVAAKQLDGLASAQKTSAASAVKEGLPDLRQRHVSLYNRRASYASHLWGSAVVNLGSADEGPSMIYSPRVGGLRKMVS
eukprot:Gregarina_sp_Poly_1__5602@NODE_2958_length_1504_cov_1555_455115_g1867_i0_p3_GENE_NODE_2958_length_1504_cov_1555_455115_g1867_i0NODE_2958_length_1504_cov_1555_455115_g1867_i0_p3_ORF_typecomplete_len101_score12_24_NODE_2958_length_1504_cov_1555_455115_g1867_i0395697